MGSSNFCSHTLEGLIMGGPWIKKPQSWGEEKTTLVESFVCLFFEENHFILIYSQIITSQQLV